MGYAIFVSVGDEKVLKTQDRQDHVDAVLAQLVACTKQNVTDTENNPNHHCGLEGKMIESLIPLAMGDDEQKDQSQQRFHDAKSIYRKHGERSRKI
jgi:hypothetical protein